MTPPKLLISEFSTLNFRTDWRLEFQYPTRYVQRLLRTDVIDTQYVISGDFQGALRIVLFDGSGSVLAQATGTELGPIDSGTAYRADWPEGTFPLPCGCYTMAFGLQPYNLILASSPFRVVDELPDSVLFEVANDEDEFGTVFSGQQFRFRAEAVWLPADAAFQSENQTFRDQNGTLHQLSATPYETRVLTVGGGVSTVGVPNWVGRKVNKLLACSAVTIDGAAYARSEGAGVERTDIADNWPLFLYKVTLEPADDTHALPLPQQWLLAAEDGRIITTEDGKAIDIFPHN